MKIFKDLHALWFDEHGQETMYLKGIIKNGINLLSIFKNLCDIWFDKNGNKTDCIKVLEEKGVGLADLPDIIDKTGVRGQSYRKIYGSIQALVCLKK